MDPTKNPTPLFAVEAATWLVATVLATLTTLSTVAAQFPARAQSLRWEGALVVIAAVFAAAAVRRTATGRPYFPGRFVAPRVLIRIALVLPWAFALLVAAAGFSA